MKLTELIAALNMLCYIVMLNTNKQFVLLLFTFSRKLLGIIVSPLCWKNNEWVGLSVACSLKSLVTSLDDVTRSLDKSPTINRDIMPKSWDQIGKLGQ